jgi:hypothetical protein
MPKVLGKKRVRYKTAESTEERKGKWVISKLVEVQRDGLFKKSSYCRSPKEKSSRLQS